MTKVTETTGRQTQVRLLTNMLEDIAQDLAPQYEGNVVVRRYGPDTDMYIPGYRPFLYVAEEKPGKRFLGIFPRTERRILFAANEGFHGGACGKKDMHTCLADDKAEAVVKKYLDQYVKEHGVTEVHMQRGF